MIKYSINAYDPKAHLFKVKLEIDEPVQPTQKLRLPNWIPGSYLIRDFAKNLIDIKVTTNSGQAIPLESVDKSNWSFSSTEAVVVEYFVYAWDLSVRSAHFDESHGFFNGTSTFIEVVGQTDQPCQMNITSSEVTQSHTWRVATGMPAVDIDANGFGCYEAENYSALIDYPVEMGTFTEISFEANGIPHRMVLTGIFNLDENRLKQDLIKICETELKLFGTPAPIDDYLFQVMVTGSDYGGLEHRNSTALICSRNDLPYPGMTEPSDGYLQFLELCSHEYFHTWNVKRIQPKVYQTSDLQTPVYTNQLWWFEGVTSYYDALILHRAGVVNTPTYLKLLAQQMTRVYRMPGRFKQSVAESSWMTWTKFYQQDENAPNAIISYYTKGSLIALALDLKIRNESQSTKSLDDVLLHLWQNFGAKGVGLEDGEIESICSKVTGLDLSEFFERFLFGTEDLPFDELFKPFGIEFKLQAPTSLEDTGGVELSESTKQLPTFLGANLTPAESSLKVTHVWAEQPVCNAGLAAGDLIIAINNLKISNKTQVEQLLQQSSPGQTLSCHFFRRDELRQTEICLTTPPVDRVALKLSDDDSSITKWLAKQ